MIIPISNTTDTNSSELSQPYHYSPTWLVDDLFEFVSTVHSVLGTLLKNKSIPDPFYGLENETITDIADSGRDYYTFWFFTKFQCKRVSRPYEFAILKHLNRYLFIYLFAVVEPIRAFEFSCNKLLCWSVCKRPQDCSPQRNVPQTYTWRYWYSASW